MKQSLKMKKKSLAVQKDIELIECDSPLGSKVSNFRKEPNLQFTLSPIKKRK